MNCMNIIRKNMILTQSRDPQISEDDENICNCLPACYSVEYDAILSQAVEETDLKLKSQ
jgi:hypothetical protein